MIEQIANGKILSYAAKWLGKKTFVRGWIDFKRNKEYQLVKELWNLLNEADIVIGQNHRSFDIKWCNTAFIRYGLPPPSPYKTIDTKVEAKKFLYLPSYALNNIASYFGVGRKIEHEGFPLWVKCVNGDRRAWDRMKRYNAHDVDLTEKVYLKLMPFITNHPAKAFYENCSNCNGKQISRGYERRTKAVFRKLQCKSCGSWSSIKLKNG